MSYEEARKRYDELVARCDRIERKGKTMPYTSANGYMFSLLNKAGEIGIRFSKDVQKKIHGGVGFDLVQILQLDYAWICSGSRIDARQSG